MEPWVVVVVVISTVVVVGSVVLVAEHLEKRVTLIFLAFLKGFNFLQVSI